ncbi:Zinc finger protein CONSTANS-LIKE 2 [Apostasia shenzhenica]|uniref:Zinc finger protein CONSTANS-LIKE 2 n=1 Tax=Apostasia shenzhenica TaxID=1088818 RepID=A0A2I0AUB1_9ASPA|nr:Zinc finger protein CONSTANS-LIKE 2 [Apostasia shenzhenica]
MLKAEGDATAGARAAASWCDSCRSAPCSVYCRADAAYLCGGCDAAVHAANSLARRHRRVPVAPIPAGGLVVGFNAAFHQFLRRPEEAGAVMEDPEEDDDGFFAGGEVEDYLDLIDFSSCEDDQSGETKGEMIAYGCEMEEGIDGVVPVRRTVEGDDHDQQQCFQMIYEDMKVGFEGSPALSHQNISVSSMEGASIPEATMIGISSSQIWPSKGTIDLFSGPPAQTPQQFTPRDREARVLRYREKRKMRKFEKIIRYASRKAYAETRPRIKGRFAKRTTNIELQVNQMFAAPVNVMVETSYGVVPSF